MTHGATEFDFIEFHDGTIERHAHELTSLPSSTAAFAMVRVRASRRCDRVTISSR